MRCLRGNFQVAIAYFARSCWRLLGYCESWDSKRLTFFNVPIFLSRSQLVSLPHTNQGLKDFAAAQLESMAFPICSRDPESTWSNCWELSVWYPLIKITAKLRIAGSREEGKCIYYQTETTTSSSSGSDWSGSICHGQLPLSFGKLHFAGKHE